MFLVVTESNDTWKWDNQVDAETHMSEMARAYLMENPTDKYSICLVNFETKVSTVYEYEISIRLTRTAY